MLRIDKFLTKDMLKPNTFYIDSKEKDTANWPVISAAIEFFENLGYDVVVAPLFVGDYIFNNVCFERKIISDFVSSIQIKHLQDQCARMKEAFPYCFVLLEGSRYDYIYADDNFGKRKFSENQFNGAIASLIMNYEVSVPPEFEIYTDLFDFIHRVIKKSDPNKKKIDINHLFTKRRDVYCEDILMCTEGISKIKAKALLKDWSIDEIRHGSAKEIAKDIRGIGPATVEKIQNDLNKMIANDIIKKELQK